MDDDLIPFHREVLSNARRNPAVAAEITNRDMSIPPHPNYSPPHEGTGQPVPGPSGTQQAAASGPQPGTSGTGGTKKAPTPKPKSDTSSSSSSSPPSSELKKKRDVSPVIMTHEELKNHSINVDSNFVQDFLYGDSFDCSNVKIQDANFWSEDDEIVATYASINASNLSNFFNQFQKLEKSKFLDNKSPLILSVYFTDTIIEKEKTLKQQEHLQKALTQQKLDEKIKFVETLYKLLHQFYMSWLTKTYLVEEMNKVFEVLKERLHKYEMDQINFKFKICEKIEQIIFRQLDANLDWYHKYQTEVISQVSGEFQKLINLFHEPPGNHPDHNINELFM
jgi:hypothetical protein